MDPTTTLILTFIELLISGFFVGILAIMVGIGGGIVYNPLLIFAFSVDPRIASVISSFVIIFTSGSGFLKYRAAKRLDIQTTKKYLILAVPGAIIGAYIGTIISVPLIKILFGIFIGASAIRGIYKLIGNKGQDLISEEEGIAKGFEKRKLIDSDADVIEYYINMKTSQPFAFVGGLVAGLLGVGGGIIFSPLMVILAKIPVHIAMATSASIITVVSFVAFTVKIIGFAGTGLFTFDYFITYAIPLAIGAVIGARFGAGRVKKIDSKKLLTVFWTIALISSLKMAGLF